MKLLRNKTKILTVEQNQNLINFDLFLVSFWQTEKPYFGVSLSFSIFRKNVVSFLGFEQKMTVDVNFGYQQQLPYDAMSARQLKTWEAPGVKRQASNQGDP